MKGEVLINLDVEFKRAFPAFDFSLRDLQKTTIRNVIEGRNTLCILPTGAGKSIVYWMSGIMSNGVTIVVSPLIALIIIASPSSVSEGVKYLSAITSSYFYQSISKLKFSSDNKYPSSSE